MPDAFKREFSPKAELKKTNVELLAELIGKKVSINAMSDSKVIGEIMGKIDALRAGGEASISIKTSKGLINLLNSEIKNFEI